LILRGGSPKLALLGGGGFFTPSSEQDEAIEIAVTEHFRRTDPRYERKLEVEIVSGESRQTGHTKNISLGGLYLEAKEAAPLHSTIQVRFRVPTAPDPIEVAAEVRWVVPAPGPGQPAGMGVRFSGLRAREVWALNRYFQT
jgi:uncharacterized protein (TIGR02266 family)